MVNCRGLNLMLRRCGFILTVTFSRKVPVEPSPWKLFPEFSSFSQFSLLATVKLSFPLKGSGRVLYCKKLLFCRPPLLTALQVVGHSVSMEDSPEQSHWASPTLLSSDALASFSSEPGLLPPGEESEAFFSSQDSDLSGLPSFFSSPNHSRAPSAYRHSSGRCFRPLSPIIQILASAV